jgi:hypothetical protein
LNKLNLKLIGALPEYYAIAEYLWGKGVNIDSDGNSPYPESLCWTELTLILREDESQRVDIDPHDTLENTLIASSTSRSLLERVDTFLRQYGSIE